MTAPLVELARRGAEAFNVRDIDGYLELMDSEVETVSRLVGFEGGYHGHDGCRAYWRDLLDAIPDLTAEVVDVIDLGHVTITVEHLRGHGAGSDVPLDEIIWAVVEWRDEKCVWLSPQYKSEEEAMEVARERQGRAERSALGTG